MSPLLPIGPDSGGRRETARHRVSHRPREANPSVCGAGRVAGGYSEIAIYRGRAVTMELRDGADFIVSLDAATGREHWSVRVGPTYRGHGGSDDGPISTPAVDGNDLFALGPRVGRLSSLQAAGSPRR